MITTIVTILVLLAVASGFTYLLSYNGLVQARQNVADAWAVIDLELQRRHDLIPQLVNSVQAAAVHERHVLDELIARERSAAAAAHTAADRSSPEALLAASASAVIALREMYPALNSQANFLRLQHDLAITEDRISAARRFHNLKVAELNRRTEAFPSNVVARSHRIDRGDYFGEH
ncbi:MAG: LemA family protein [Ilumatobacter sp.]